MNGGGNTALIAVVGLVFIVFCCCVAITFPYAAVGTVLFQGVKSLGVDILRRPEAVSETHNVISDWYFDEVDASNIDPFSNGGPAPSFVPGFHGTVPCVGVEVEPAAAVCQVPIEGPHYLTGGWEQTSGYNGKHKGIDWGTYGKNLPIVNIMRGGVTYSNWHKAGYGYLVVVENFGWQVFYGHMCCDPSGGVATNAGGRPSMTVSSSQDSENPIVVDVYHVLGQVGNTGNSTGAHLHFEIRECTVEPPSSKVWDPSVALLPGMGGFCPFQSLAPVGRQH